MKKQAECENLGETVKILSVRRTCVLICVQRALGARPSVDAGVMTIVSPERQKFFIDVT
jgi:hypothetical protein